LQVDEPAAILLGTHGVTTHIIGVGIWNAQLAEDEVALRARLDDERFARCKARGAATDDNQVASLMRVELSRIGEAEASS
jgi:hypothetical protein